MNRSQRRWRLAAFAALTVLAASACGGGGGGSTTPGGGGGSTPTSGGSPTQGASPTDEGDDDFDAEAFFRGQTIDVVVNANTGGGSDTFTRLIMANFGDYVPGNPRFQVTNQVGVGAMATVYDAPENDLVIGTVSKGSRLYASQIEAAATHDIADFQFIGALGDDPRVLMIFNDPAQAYDNIVEAQDADSPLFRFSEVVGDATAVVEGAFFASWICYSLNLACQMVAVADGGATSMLPMVERNELNWIDTNTPSALRTYSEHLQRGDAKILAEYSTSEFTEILTPDISRPDVADILPADMLAEYERILPLVGGGGSGATFYAGPNFPPQAVAALQQAWLDYMDDPDNAAQVAVAKAGVMAEGAEYNLTAMSGEETERYVMEQAELFFENLSYYEELQQLYWNEYWAR